LLERRHATPPEIQVYILQKVKEVKVAPVNGMEVYRESERTTPLTFNLNNRWRRVVNFMPQPLHSQGGSTLCPLNRRLAGP
jgi:hypothetical protein